MAGLRVVRGPDWKWENQDGGEGYVGTTTGKKASNNWINVLWDIGRKNDYRAGANDSSDLLVLDNGPAGVHHPGVMCDACKENNIRGLRWKCVDCPDYDLCTECYGNDKHDRNHRFKRRDTHDTDMVNVGKRQNAVKLQARGIYSGATVVRGENWDKGDQDGGVGCVGTVTKVGYVEEGGQHKAAVVVKWARDSSTGYIYRLGLGGNVDVKCKTAAIGWSYYRDHLPHLRDAKRIGERTPVRHSSGDATADVLAQLFTASLQMLAEGLGNDIGKAKQAKRAETMSKFKEGDLVRLHHDIDTVRRLQQGHGSFNILMIPTLGKTGVVKNIDDDGDVQVRFGGVEWVLNPAVLTKVSVPQPTPVRQAVIETVPSNSTAPFKTGERVVINKDVETVKALQRGHGGWNDSMTPFVGTGVVGIVRAVDSDNDLSVAFGDKTFLFNPEVCSEAPKGPRPAKNQNEVAAGSSSTFKVGDRVRIDPDMDFVKRSQIGHGGWHENMKKGAKSTGIVKEIDKDGDLKVEFESNTWTLNPEVCRKAKAGNETPSKEKNVNKSANETLAAQAPAFRVGDRVTLDSNVDFVKRMQEGHGGWSADMEKSMHSVGVVEGVDADGDIKVNFQPVTWLLNPAVCHKAESEAEPKKKDDNQQYSSSPRRLKLGDRVKMLNDIEKIKQLQKGHGGWNNSMRNSIPVVGKVVALDTDGDVTVDFAGTSWTLNPQVVREYEEPANISARPKDVNKSKNANGQEDRAPRKLKPGDSVKMISDVERIKHLQSGHGGWSDDMKSSITVVGKVVDLDTDGDVTVDFAGTSWTLNPQVLRIYEEPANISARPKDVNKSKNVNEEKLKGKRQLKPGDAVKMISDVERIKQLQRGHGGWNDAMKAAIPVTGKVLAFDADGDVEVDFGGTSWTLNTEILQIYEEPASRARTKDNNETKNVNARKPDGATAAGASSKPPGGFTVGDQVKIQANEDELKVLQRGHGGHNEGMIKAIGNVGVLKSIDTDGDLLVEFPTGKFSLNPRACVSLDPVKSKLSESKPIVAPGAKELRGQNSTDFVPGDCVKIALDVELVLALQQGHGGWDGAMGLAIGKVGVISEVLSSGDVKVNFGDNCWTFNPAVFMLINAGEGSKPMPAPKPKHLSSPRSITAKYQCSICFDRGINVVFNCGHGTCEVCSKSIEICHICRSPIALRTKMFL